MKPENIENVENGGVAGWESVGEVEFAGDKLEVERGRKMQGGARGRC